MADARFALDPTVSKLTNITLILTKATLHFTEVRRCRYAFSNVRNQKIRGESGFRSNFHCFVVQLLVGCFSHRAILLVFRILPVPTREIDLLRC